MRVRIDLHTHSDVSDGTQPPAGLVRAAADAGLDVMALTDHDTAAGWAEAVATAAEVGIRVVPGMEISTELDGHGVHLLAYLPDPRHPALAAELAAVLEGRNARLPATIAKLQAEGVEIEIDDVLAAVAGVPAALGRPHVADALVARGVVADRSEAFDRWLSAGRPGYVRRYAADLTTMIGVVRDAGGVTVVAHPWGRTRTPYLTAERIAALAEAGLAGIEVDHEDHTPDVRRTLRGIAGDLGLVITGSSDHHGAGKEGHGLGCNTTAPTEFERLMERAAAARRATGRPVQEEYAWTL